MSNGEDPFDFVKKLVETHRQIRFGRGLVGKTTNATLGLLALWGIVLWRLSGNPWLDIPLFLGGGVATAVYIWWIKRTHVFAEKNPSVALLEGAQLLE